MSFSLQAAEREAEDITGHMGPRGGALMTGWDAIPSYDYTDILIKLCRWKTQTGMHTYCL